MTQMNYKASKFTVLMMVLAILLSCKDHAPDKLTAPGIPAASVQARAGIGQIKIKVEIPANHHAYLDSGPEELFIPLSFNWASLLKEKQIAKKPEKIQAPKGEREKSGVHVLRGMGDFIFAVPESMKLQGKTIKVRTQLCDDIQGVCYRPQQSEITIQ